MDVFENQATHDFDSYKKNMGSNIFGESSICGNNILSNKITIATDYFKDLPLATSIVDQNESIEKSKFSPRDKYRDPVAICEAAYFPLRARRKKANRME